MFKCLLNRVGLNESNVGRGLANVIFFLTFNNWSNVGHGLLNTIFFVPFVYCLFQKVKLVSHVGIFFVEFIEGILKAIDLLFLKKTNTHILCLLNYTMQQENFSK